MIIKTVAVTPFSQNARLVIDEPSRCASVIDPGGEVELLLRLIAESEVTVESVFLTHAHIDHCGGVAELLSKLPGAIPLYAHRGDAELRSTIEAQAQYFGLSPQEYRNAPEPDHYLEHGDAFQIGGASATVLFTPGHAPGHIALFFPWEESNTPHRIEVLENRRLTPVSAFQCSAPILLAGDALFAGSIGRTDLPAGNHQQLLESITTHLLSKPDETLVLSGHGPETTIGRERRSNPFLHGM